MGSEHSRLKRLGARALEQVGLLRPAYWLRQKARLASLGDELESAPDGLPVPPPRLRYFTGNNPDLAAFLNGGHATARILRRCLAESGIDPRDADAVLDFGCGCGRILRHLLPLVEHGRPALHGTDVNPELVAWCTANLRVVSCVQIDRVPPLLYRDGAFDIVLAISVLTHLTEENGRAWLREFRRVLRPGGLLALSLHGDHFAERFLDGRERDRYLRGELVVCNEALETTNGCFAVHPPSYVRSRLLEGFRLRGVYSHAEVPEIGIQDLYVAEPI